MKPISIRTLRKQRDRAFSRLCRTREELRLTKTALAKLKATLADKERTIEDYRRFIQAKPTKTANF